MMTRDTRHKEILLREVLFSALDSSRGARSVGSPVLIYLTDMMVQRARAELYDLRAHCNANQADDTALPDV